MEKHLFLRPVHVGGSGMKKSDSRAASCVRKATTVSTGDADRFCGSPIPSATSLVCCFSWNKGGKKKQKPIHLKCERTPMEDDDEIDIGDDESVPPNSVQIVILPDTKKRTKSYASDGSVSQRKEKKPTKTRKSWSTEEENTFQQAIHSFGRDYRKIQEFLPQRLILSPLLGFHCSKMLTIFVFFHRLSQQ
jgi:hypothetical protein